MTKYNGKMHVLGWVEKSKMLIIILGHVDVDPVVIQKDRDFLPDLSYYYVY